MNNTIFETIQYPHRLCMYLTIVDYPKDARQILHITLWLVLIACGYCTNGLFLYTILQSHNLRKNIMNRLLSVLSVIDIFILTNELVYIAYPFSTSHVPWKDAFRNPLVVGPVWFYSLCEHFSEGILIVIAYERFRAICYPFTNLQKHSFLVLSVILVVVASVIFTGGYAYVFYYGDSQALGVFLLLLLVGPSVIPFFISAILYSFVIYTMIKSARDIVAANRDHSRRHKKNRKQVIVVLFVNTFVYFALNALRKYFDTRLAQAFTENSSRNPGHDQYDFIEGAWHWASYMALCMILNSTVNPIIYNFGSYQYRQAMFRSVFCFKTLRNRDFRTGRSSNHQSLYTVSKSFKAEHVESSENSASTRDAPANPL